MKKLINIWKNFIRLVPNEMNSGIVEKNQEDLDVINLHQDLKCILKINNGQKKSETGIFGKLQNGKMIYEFHYLDFKSILKFHKKIKRMKINAIGDTEIPFAILEAGDIGAFGFSINSQNGEISYISFCEYDYNGGTVHNKGKYKYANNMIEFLENQINLKQFE